MTGHDGAPGRIGLVGLGVIGRVHRDVLATVAPGALRVVVDPTLPDDHGDDRDHRDGRDGEGADDAVRHHRSLAEALAAGPSLDLVVVATPTDTHLDLVGELLTGTRATVLSEKPLARELAPLVALEENLGEELARLRVVNHFAYSPEVAWAAATCERHGWGAPELAVATFNDPYVLKTPRQRTSYVSPWVDSGANQLSMLGRFVEGWAVCSHEEDPAGLRSVTELTYDGGRATLLASWWTGDSSKQTSLRWSGGRELLLDHTAMTGHLFVEGRLVEHLGHDGRTSRKHAHYEAMYRALFADPDVDALSVRLAREVTRLLDAAAAAGGAAKPPRWR